jgi:Tfp pilus assembly protein PilZ
VNGIDDDSNGYVDDFRGWNFVANSNDPMDDEGHGTHVSGIILGVSQDITAATLQPAKVKIMPVKFLDSSGSGSTSNAVLAIDYAIQNGARVLNNSWGGGSFSNSLLTAISSAYDKKVVFAAAAGNAGTDNDASPTYPASYTVPNIISVAATSDSDALASFSNYGANTVHLGSPGVSIYSTYPNDLFARESGTSMATPFIAGVAALVLREKPSMNAYQVKQLILTSANSATSLSGKTTTGARANFANPINAAKITAVSSSEPSFNLDAARQPASDGSSGSAGCGLVSSMTREGGEPPTPFGQLVEIMMSIVLLTAPLVVGLFLRNRVDGRARRKHERFQFKSTVSMKVGDRELKGEITTISVGGVQVNTDQWLEEGGVVTMSIRSPDGKDEIQVDGKVVWSEERKSYGVAFANAEDSTRAVISRWTKLMTKA